MLGEYKLNEIYNEDCYDAIKKIPDKSIDCIYVDIPYLYSSGYHKHENKCGVGIKKEFVNQLSTIINGIDYLIYDEFIRISKIGNIFIWCSKEQILDTLNFFINKGFNYDILFWGKTNPQPLARNSWLSDVEYCLYFKKTGVVLNDGFDHKSKWFISSLNQKDKSLFEHPTIKPLNFVKRHLIHTTQENDIVADFFLGSGTTCVAAKEIGRQYIGFEIDKDFYNIAKNRLNGINANGQISIFTDTTQDSLF